jgi:Protein of unknown function (DUF2934)
MVEHTEVSREAIARRAHELYVERGYKNGNEVEDWLTAEKEFNGNPVGTPLEIDRGRSKSLR